MNGLGATLVGASIVAVLAAVLAAVYAISYNRLIRRRHEVADAWATIDAELQRRHALVPQLVSAVRAAAAHERQLLADLAQRNAEAAASAHTPATASVWEPPLTTAIAHVIALRERYPQLNAQRNFLALQGELATTEDRIAAARRYYNTRVVQLNTAVEAFPSRVVAGRHGIGRAEFFDAD